MERFLGTVTTELLPMLPGHLVRGKPITSPAMSLPDCLRQIAGSNAREVCNNDGAPRKTV